MKQNPGWAYQQLRKGYSPYEEATVVSNHYETMF